MYKLINEVRQKNPLVLHYTNEVTINDCANITLAIGASPLMSYSYEEVEEIVQVASSVVINIGTMNSANLELFIKAGKACNKFNKPVILDPVGVFATKTRSDFTNRLLNEVKFDVVKGNAAEIKYIGGFNVNGKGVDSFDDEENLDEVIKAVAKKLECIVVATGKVDSITDGEKVCKIDNGTAKLKSITGTGCMSASLIGSFIGACEDKFKGATMGVLSMSLSGELANSENPSIGNFKVKLMDTVYSLNSDIYEKYAKVETI
ncbi:hydroxyethylthiazole kinase [Romboutsia sp.]|uniref:hydroxyethylthiazole kinase n=1 Tax=Romboutsia sp. TaxID=1965302 RepID=UPI003F2D49F2